MKKIFWAFDLSYPLNNGLFSSWLLNDKFIVYKDPTQCLNQEQGPLHSPNPNSDPEKLRVTVCLSDTNVINCCFLDPRKTLIIWESAQQPDEIRQNLQCLQLAQANGEGPCFLLHYWVWCHPLYTLVPMQRLCHPLYSPDFLPTSCFPSTSWQIIGRKTLPRSAEWRSLYNPRAQILTL